MSKVVYRSTHDPKTNSELPETEKSQVEFLKTKLKLTTQSQKVAENESKELRQENDKLRQLNSEYIKQLNQMAVDKHVKIEKIVVSQQFFEQKNIDTQLKDFIRKMTSNFSGLEKQHAKLIDHCRVMENDINYYRERVRKADEINDNLRSVGKTNISELMDELRNLQNQVDTLSNEVQKSNFDLSVKQSEYDRKVQEVDYMQSIQDQLQASIDDIKTKQNRLLSDHVEKSNKDAKLIYQLKLKSDFLEHERRLAYQDASFANNEKQQLVAKSQCMENELDVLRNTTESFLKKNKHIFNLTGLPKMSFK